jgi:hypothetical protein
MAKVRADMAVWATTNDFIHRSACYGTDAAKWPKP